MACAASTDRGGTAVDLDSRWELDPRVAVRPESFGALLYHFGTRRLSFLKSPLLLAVVRGLGSAPSVRVACADAGVVGGELETYRRALTSLAASGMIRAREPG